MIKEENMKYKFKQVWKNIKLYASLPHFWIFGIILILSIIACACSVMLMKSNPFLSSIFANIFAGLVTGIVLSLISTIKSITLYQTTCLVEWLSSLHEDILNYIEMYQKMIFKCQKDIDDTETFDDHIYDTLCCGNEINVKISQGRFDCSLPFNSYKYVKNNFKYDATYYSEKNEKLREQILLLDAGNITINELRNLFKDMDNELRHLNSKILKRITYLETKKKAINVSIM